MSNSIIPCSQLDVPGAELFGGYVFVPQSLDLSMGVEEDMEATIRGKLINPAVMEERMREVHRERLQQ